MLAIIAIEGSERMRWKMTRKRGKKKTMMVQMSTPGLAIDRKAS